MKTEEKNILVTVKAYPNPSTKYGETVCCAGIDLGSNSLIRIYPIPYRDLDDTKRFKKYSTIKAKCYKASDDKRPESYKVLFDSIEILDWWDTSKEWKKRKEKVLPTLAKSMCYVYEQSQKNDLSLALIEPDRIDFVWDTAKSKDKEKREKCYAQLSFFNKRKKTIEQIPYNFYYTFHCKNAPSCAGHKLLIIDWEIGQAYRSWRWKYRKQEILLEKIKERWMKRICSNKNDVYFFVGNMKRFRDIFMTLGVFYPPK